MEIRGLAVKNVGGLRDCDLIFPDSSIIAFAGANGTGKSKLLACMLTPWTQAMPPAANDQLPAEVRIRIGLSSHEQQVLTTFWQESTSHVSFFTADGQQQNVPLRSLPVQMAPEAEVVYTFAPLTGLQRTGEPLGIVLIDALSSPQVMQRAPSLDLHYIPAERRLLASVQSGVNLDRLSEHLGWETSQRSRQAAQGYGHFDDQEFEDYAKALCVAGSLQPEPGDEVSTVEQTTWQRFKKSVDELLAPKELLPLTQRFPQRLRIGLPDGNHHPIEQLSSGERQALIIVSQVFRAGEGRSLIAIDEPDAYLHPSLSLRLLKAIESGLEDGGRLVVATHSPAILDSIQPGAIFRLSHTEVTRAIGTESERLSLYREAGFRASAVTQSDLLLVVEGETDSELLPRLLPTLGNVTVKVAKGRASVLKSLESLHGLGLPIVGVVDLDVHATLPSPEIESVCHTWGVSDIEAAILSDDAALGAAIAGALVKPEFSDVAALRTVLNDLLLAKRENAVAEIVQRKLRPEYSVKWPSVRGLAPVDRLRGLVGSMPALTGDRIDSEIQEAERLWDEAVPEPWSLVRGKWISGEFVSRVSEFKSADGFFIALATRNPQLAEMRALATKIEVARKASTS
jgi:hypothetical protein